MSIERITSVISAISTLILVTLVSDPVPKLVELPASGTAIATETIITEWGAGILAPAIPDFFMSPVTVLPRAERRGADNAADVFVEQVGPYPVA